MFHKKSPLIFFGGKKYPHPTYHFFLLKTIFLGIFSTCEGVFLVCVVLLYTGLAFCFLRLVICGCVILGILFVRCLSYMGDVVLRIFVIVVWVVFLVYLQVFCGVVNAGFMCFV